LVDIIVEKAAQERLQPWWLLMALQETMVSLSDSSIIEKYITLIPGSPAKVIQPQVLRITAIVKTCTW